MDFDPIPARRVQPADAGRLLAAAAAWAGGGSLALAAWQCPQAPLAARLATGGAALALLAGWLAWPLLTRLAEARRAGWSGGAGDAHAGAAPGPFDLREQAFAKPTPLQAAEARADAAHRQHVQAQALWEHLPVAAWCLREGQLLPLSSRARRLLAPGGVRDAEVLRQLLLGAVASGPVLLDTERGAERWQLQCQTLALDARLQRLLVLVPLESALEAETLQAWEQLVRVLTHEIMNSLTPIQSLSRTAQGLVDEPDGEADLRAALEAIARRAGSLSGFVQTYRRISQWPAPQLAPVDLAALFARLAQAVGPAWRARGGQASFACAEPGLRLQADEGQLEQALLALVQNAAEATEATAGGAAPAPALWVQARQSRGGRLQITVRDNGPGVPAGLERQIFLPFFSAREGGQGIGLTVVRQLVHGMGGRVRHVRPVEGGAAFVLSF